MDEAPTAAMTRNHLIVTDSLKARGQIRHVPGRLGDFLRAREAPTIRIEDVEVELGPEGEGIPWSSATLNLGHVTFAHEYVDVASDLHLQSSDVTERVPVAVVLQSLTLRGRMAPQEILTPRRFFSLTEVEVTMAEGDGQWLADAIRSVSWLLINRDRVQAILEEIEPS